MPLLCRRLVQDDVYQVNQRIVMNLNKYVGDWGCAQALIYFVAGMAPFISGSQIMAFVFTAYMPDSRCFIPGVDIRSGENKTDFDNPIVKSRLLQYYFVDDSQPSAKCRYCKQDRDVTRQEPSNCSMELSEECSNDLIYSRRPIRTSLVERFDMNCEQNRWKRQMLPSLMMTGVLFGAIIGGTLGDRFGRRPVFISLAICGVVAYHSLVVAPTYAIFCLLQFAVGFCSNGSGVVIYCATMEINGGIWRTITGIWWQGFFAAGYLYVGIIAYFVREWQYVQLAVALPSLLMVPCLVAVIPESVRWLLAKGDLMRAGTVIRKIARINRINIVEDDLRLFLIKEKGKVEKANASILVLWQYPRVLRDALIVFYLWFSCSMAYYGLSLNTNFIPGDLYLNYFITGLMELPGFLAAMLMMEKLGRRRTIMILVGFGGVAVVACSLLPPSMSLLALALAAFGKLGTAAGFAVAYNYAIEVFPTVVRSTGVGFASAAARIAAIISPQIGQLGVYVQPWLPFLIYGLVAASSALFMLLAPETTNQPLFQTVEEAIAASKNAHVVRSDDGGMDEEATTQLKCDGVDEIT